MKDPLKLDERAIVEGVIKYGDMKEIRQLMKVLGVNKIKGIFTSQVRGRRSNYEAKTINYFKLYFNQYAKYTK